MYVHIYNINIYTYIHTYIHTYVYIYIYGCLFVTELSQLFRFCSFVFVLMACRVNAQYYAQYILTEK